MAIVKRINKKWEKSDRVPYGHDETSSAEAYFDEPVHIQSQTSMAYDYLDQELNQLNNVRRENYRLYEQMDDTYAPAAAVLDAYADNATQVDLDAVSAAQHEAHIVQFISPDEKVRESLAALRERVQLDERAWSLARDLAKNGEVFEEVIVTQSLDIDRLKQLPADYMVRNQDEYGLLRDNAFYQLDKDTNRVRAVFSDWEIIHYRVLRRNEDVYGTSVLKAVRKVYKQLKMIEDAMVIARLTRANSRLVFMIDTSGLTPVKAVEHLEKMKKMLRKKNVLNYYGQNRAYNNPLSVEEDIFMTTTQGSSARVDQLYGDLNIGNLRDVEYFQNQFFGGVKVPKGYIGLEKDIKAKQTLTMQDIQFARTIRRIQMAMRVGYKQLCDLHFVLQSSQYDTSNPPYAIALPTQQTIDELRQWEMKRVQAEVARYYVQELYLDPLSVYELVLGFSADQAKRLFQGSQDEYLAAQRNKNAIKSFNAQRDKKLGMVDEAVMETLTISELEAFRALCEMALEKKKVEESEEKGHVI